MYAGKHKPLHEARRQVSYAQTKLAQAEGKFAADLAHRGYKITQLEAKVRELEAAEESE